MGNDIRAGTKRKPREREIEPDKTPIEQARDLPADKLEYGADTTMRGELFQMAAYSPEGELYYKKELIDDKYNEMMYEIHIIGRSKPKPRQVEEAQTQAAAVLAAYEHTGTKLPKKKRDQLRELAEGDTAAAMHQIKDNRRVGATEIPKVKHQSTNSAASDDLRKMGDENRMYLARVRGRKEGGSRKPLPQFKESRLKKAA